MLRKEMFFSFLLMDEANFSYSTEYTQDQKVVIIEILRRIMHILCSITWDCDEF